jgi:hypothetical protein
MLRMLDRREQREWAGGRVWCFSKRPADAMGQRCTCTVLSLADLNACGVEKASLISRMDSEGCGVVVFCFASSVPDLSLAPAGQRSWPCSKPPANFGDPAHHQ